ncbi:sensor domain-containing diguanylate cyclase [Pseudomonas turukhanskensis]|uniref:diguanylate cyclase n=1 Tax=Pseudomonas turukhanskensis TaxID=1806536 RepID=A0A9W6K8I8_9PSED|nr:sensor domain-containing diguanylate cyclase [Pseudomonas turukhanskensis]GLK90153.1 response regulator [Pseudomonas turukhanskensis]
MDRTQTLHIDRLRNLTYGLVCFGLIVVLALEGWQLYQSYRQAFFQARQAATNLTRATEAHVRDAIRQADTLLVGVVERSEWEGLERLNSSRMQTFLKRQVGVLPQLHGLFIYDRNGRWLVTDSGQIPANANNADREYFMYHREHDDPGVHIGRVITSRSTGELVIPVSRRINAADGSFAGVALATLKVAYFNDFYAQFRVSKEDAFTLTYYDGTILVRRPFVPDVIGTSIAQGQIFKDLLPLQDAGTALIESSIDGKERMYSFQRFGDFPLVAISGISAEAIRLPWWRQLIVAVVVLILIGLSTAAFARVLLQQISRSELADRELRNAHKALRKFSLEDALTGLANRRRLDDVLPQELGRVRRTRAPLGVIMLDIDYFKLYNDRYGHVAGDAAIQAVAGVLASYARRAEDLPARYGGEEMMLLLPGANEANSLEIAQGVRQAVFDLAREHQGSPLGIVTVSLGVAVAYPHQAENNDVAALIKQADTALYQAKSQGRNQACAYQAPDVTGARRST